MTICNQTITMWLYVIKLYLYVIKLCRIVTVSHCRFRCAAPRDKSHDIYIYCYDFITYTIMTFIHVCAAPRNKSHDTIIVSTYFELHIFITINPLPVFCCRLTVSSPTFWVAVVTLTSLYNVRELNVKCQTGAKNVQYIYMRCTTW